MKQEPPGFPKAMPLENGKAWCKKAWVLEEVEAWHRTKIAERYKHTD
jgi:hypothetical protein